MHDTFFLLQFGNLLLEKLGQAHLKHSEQLKEKLFHSIQFSLNGNKTILKRKNYILTSKYSN